MPILNLLDDIKYLPLLDSNFWRIAFQQGEQGRVVEVGNCTL